MNDWENRLTLTALVADGVLKLFLTTAAPDLPAPCELADPGRPTRAEAPPAGLLGLG